MYVILMYKIDIMSYDIYILNPKYLYIHTQHSRPLFIGLYPHIHCTYPTYNIHSINLQMAYSYGDQIDLPQPSMVLKFPEYIQNLSLILSIPSGC